jgi:hypothetical protein
MFYTVNKPCKWHDGKLNFSLNGDPDMDWELYVHQGEVWLRYKGDAGETGSINVAKLLRVFAALYANTLDLLANPRTLEDVAKELLREHALNLLMGVPDENYTPVEEE